MIRQAKILEIPDILSITKACAVVMSDQGIYQWNDHYPNAGVFENDCRRGELYVFEQDSAIIGLVVISTYKDKEYAGVPWLSPGDNSVYIHRLAVRPEFQGQGYACKLMDFAENLARRNARSSIRLDTFSRNKRNQKFYEQRRYQRLTDIYFPKQSPYPFHCYELIL